VATSMSLPDNKFSIIFLPSILYNTLKVVLVMRKIIDVTVATHNSSRTISKCLESIIKNVPYRRIVVVDAGSVDGTVKICQDLGAEIVREYGYLGKVRYVQALNCDTEWIALVDSDVYIYPEWWSKVSKYMSDRELGMVNGLAHFPPSDLKVYDKFMNFFFMKRGTVTFSNTLIRRNLVLECKDELERTHAGEDSVVVSHISEKKMKTITIKQPLCFHETNLYRHHPFAHYRWGKSVRIKYGFGGPYFGGFRGIHHQLRLWCIFTAETKQISLKLLIYLLSLSAWVIIGFFSPRRGIHDRTDRKP